MKKGKRIAVITGRSLLILIAALVILASLAGIGGVWYANRVATNVTLQAFSIVETGVSITETGVSQALTLVQNIRDEVAQARDSLDGVRANPEANLPIFIALNNRVSQRLTPAVEKLDGVLTPVQEALNKTTAVLAVTNALPGMNEKAPRLEKLGDALNEVSALLADVQQANDLLKAAAQGRQQNLTQELVNALDELLSRIDDHLAIIEQAVDDLLQQVHQLQADIQQKKAQLLLIYNLTALLISLLFLWIIYSQIVVILQQWRTMRGGDCPERAPTGPIAALPSEPIPVPLTTMAPIAQETTAATEEMAEEAASEIDDAMDAAPAETTEIEASDDATA